MSNLLLLALIDARTGDGLVPVILTPKLRRHTRGSNRKGKSSTTAQGLELDTLRVIVSENRVINRAIGLYFVLATMSHPFFGFSASGLGNTTNINKAIFYKISRYGASHSSQNHPPCQSN